MGKVIAAITTSVDGYIVGPKDGPEHGLGIGGERLHYWVMGGPWTYADDGHDTDGMHGADREYYESITDGLGCGIVGRNMYDAAGAWGACSALGVRSTPPTCGTPSGGPGRSTPRTDNRPGYATTRRRKRIGYRASDPRSAAATCGPLGPAQLGSCRDQRRPRHHPQSRRRSRSCLLSGSARLPVCRRRSRLADLQASSRRDRRAPHRRPSFA